MVNSFWLEIYFAAKQGVVGGTVEASCDEYAVQRGPSSDDEVQQVPVARFRLPPGISVMRLGGEEGVS